MDILKKHDFSFNEYQLNIIYKALTEEQQKVNKQIEKNKYSFNDVLSPLIAKSNHLNNIINDICNVYK